MSDPRVFLGLGSNLGDRAQMLSRARALLEGPDLRMVGGSRVYESPPWGMADQPWFLNQVVEIRTGLPPRALLSRCLDIEARLGRVRTVRWGPRTIDIDILLYGGLEMNAPDLIIPHPRLRHRAFALIPLEELAPGLVLPDGTAVESALAALPDRGSVREYVPGRDAARTDR